jgi:hypothetical protein
MSEEMRESRLKSLVVPSIFALQILARLMKARRQIAKSQGIRHASSLCIISVGPIHSEAVLFYSGIQNLIGTPSKGW